MVAATAAHRGAVVAVGAVGIGSAGWGGGGGGDDSHQQAAGRQDRQLVANPHETQGQSRFFHHSTRLHDQNSQDDQSGSAIHLQVLK